MRPDIWAARARDLSFFRDSRRRADGMSVCLGLRCRLGARRRPRLRGQARHVGCFAAGKPGQDIEQVFAHGHCAAPASFHDREDGRDSRAGFLASKVQPVLASERHGPDRTLGRVVVDLDLAVFEIDFQPVPDPKRVIARAGNEPPWAALPGAGRSPFA